VERSLRCAARRPGRVTVSATGRPRRAGRVPPRWEMTTGTGRNDHHGCGAEPSRQRLFARRYRWPPRRRLSDVDGVN